MRNFSRLKDGKLMQPILKGMRIIEASAFIAAPMCGTTLAQLGAEVIRFDPILGGLDLRTLACHKNGDSIYWAEMNKGKKSIAVNTKSDEGKELITELITQEWSSKWYFSTNLPATGWLSFESLSKKRTDLIQHEIIGNRDGRTALDYTVNAKVGFPLITGAKDSRRASQPCAARLGYCNRVSCCNQYFGSRPYIVLKPAKVSKLN